MATNSRPKTRTVTGLLLGANWKDRTAEIYPARGPAVKVAFPEELADEIYRAARQRVRVKGTPASPRSRDARLRVERLEVLDSVPDLEHLLAPATPEPRRDPFEGAKPIEDVWAFFGPLPDERSAEEIIEDLRAFRVPHRDDTEEDE